MDESVFMPIAPPMWMTSSEITEIVIPAHQKVNGGGPQMIRHHGVELDMTLVVFTNPRSFVFCIHSEVDRKVSVLYETI